MESQVKGGYDHYCAELGQSQLLHSTLNLRLLDHVSDMHTAHLVTNSTLKSSLY